MNQTLSGFILWTITLAVIMISIIAVLVVQSDINHNFNNYCNDKYGIGKWTIVSADRTNMSLRAKYYIGEIWTCVSLKN